MLVRICVVLLFISGKLLAQEENPLPYVPVDPVYDLAPQFPGGPDSLNSYFQKNLVYPESLKEMNTGGTVMLKFWITKKGKITEVAPVNGIPGAPECVPEAIRVVLLMPPWIPATKKGKAVETEYQLNVPFHR